MVVLREEALVRCGVTASDRVLVALSGGADSVALLLEWRRLALAGQIASLGAAHLNHGIRGEEADRDEAFCRTLCASLDVPFFSETVSVPLAAKQSGLSLEAAAREARYAFLYRTQKANDYTLLSTAHHRDDQAETLLLHLLRGCGTDGLSGMPYRSGALIRPLLDVSRAEILSFLAERNQPFCTDSTNDADDALRNRIRHAALPLLESLRPNAAKALADTAALVQTDAAYLNAEADRLFASVSDRHALAALPDALRFRVLKRYLPYDSYDRNDLFALDALLSAQTGSQRTLKQGHVAWVSSDRLLIDAPDATDWCVPLPVGEPVSVPGGTVSATRADAATFPCGANEAYLNETAICGALTVRNPRPGDRFTPFGMRGSKLLSDCFTDRKVPRLFRSVPVVWDEIGVLWVAGYTIDERARISGAGPVVHLEFRENTMQEVSNYVGQGIHGEGH